MSEITILNPKGLNLSDIHREITQEEDSIIETKTYPNGFVMKTIQYAEQVIVKTSSPLIQIDSNTYQIPE